MHPVISRLYTSLWFLYIRQSQSNEIILLAVSGLSFDEMEGRYNGVVLCGLYTKMSVSKVFNCWLIEIHTISVSEDSMEKEWRSI